MTDPRLASLNAALPLALRLLTDPADLQHYGRDWTRRWAPAPWPCRQAVSRMRCRRWCAGPMRRVWPSCLRAAARGCRVVRWRPRSWSSAWSACIRCWPSMRWIARSRCRRGLPCKLHKTPPATTACSTRWLRPRGSCSIGGTIATNAGGIRVVRCNTREWVAGLKVVTGSGGGRLGRALVKNSVVTTRRLMIASGERLGIIVEATPSSPTHRRLVMLLALPSFDALMQVFAAFRARAIAGLRISDRCGAQTCPCTWRAAPKRPKHEH